MGQLTANKAIEEAKHYYYLVQIIPEATAEEKAYYKDYFNKYPEQGNYNQFAKRALCERIELFSNNWEVDHCAPLTIFTIEQLETLIGFKKAIDEAMELCDFDEIDNIYMKENDFINSL